MSSDLVQLNGFNEGLGRERTVVRRAACGAPSQIRQGSPF